MALRTAHGASADAGQVVVVEVLPADELPSPVPAPVADATRSVRRGSDGRFLDSESAKVIGRRGGEAKARRVRLVDSLGLSTMVEQTTFGPYRSAAEEFVSHHRACLAQQAGGSLGPAPSTMIASAALQLAASRWAFDQAATTGDAALMKLGSQLANDSRQNLLAAYEIAVREAKARAEAPGAKAPWLTEGDG